LGPVTAPTAPDDGPVWRRPDRRLLQVRRVLVLIWVTSPGLVAAVVLAVLLGPAEAVAAARPSPPR
jgi:hypothetical protein